MYVMLSGLEIRHTYKAECINSAPTLNVFHKHAPPVPFAGFLEVHLACGIGGARGGLGVSGGTDDVSVPQ